MSAATGPAAGRMDLGPMRDQLQARIDVIEAEIAALEAERAELELVLGAMPSPAAAPERRRAGARRVTVGRPTAEQAERLVALLRDGPKARDDIARALGLSATRTGQLLDVLGARVASETDPDNPQAQALAARGARRDLTGSRAPARVLPRSRPQGGAFGVIRTRGNRGGRLGRPSLRMDAFGSRTAAMGQRGFPFRETAARIMPAVLATPYAIRRRWMRLSGTAPREGAGGWL
jgi:hypothetical protein